MRPRTGDSDTAMRRFLDLLWFKTGRSEREDLRTSLERAPDDVIRELVAGYAEALHDATSDPPVPEASMQALRQGDVLSLGRWTVSLDDLVNFSRAILTSEHVLDELTYKPPRIRALEIDRHAGEAGYSRDELLQIDRWWRTRRSTTHIDG